LRDAAAELGRPLWLVGGHVRDVALGRRAGDVDLVAVRGVPRIVNTLRSRLGTRGFRFRKRGVTTWRFGAAEARVDLVDATRRGLEADLARRELTINALAFELVSGSLVDTVGGLRDLRAGRLRLPRPGVIREDPVRALRLARFAAELPAFRPHIAARREAATVARGLKRTAVERQREELDRILASAAPQRGLRLLTAWGLLEAVLPELGATRRCVSGADRPDVWTHTLMTLERSTRSRGLPGGRAVLGDDDSRRVLRWALLFHDVAKPDTLEFREDGRPTFHGHESLGARRSAAALRRLKLRRAERERVVRLVRNHLRPGLLADAGAPPRGLRRLVRESGGDLPLLVVHSACDALSSGGPEDRPRRRRLRRVQRDLLELHTTRAAAPLPQLVSGRDVMRELGLAPGPRVGAALARVRDAQEEGRVRTRDAALRLLRSLPGTAP